MPCDNRCKPQRPTPGQRTSARPPARTPTCAAGFTLLFGRVADLFGRRRLFLAGIALLGVSSLVGGLATSPEVLLVARVAQGLATAAVTPAALSLLTTSFPEGPARDRALGLNGALMAAGFTAGAIVGGLLTDLLSWRWAFFVNVAVAVAVLAAAPLVLAGSRPQRRPRLDLPGSVTVTGGLLAIVYGLTAAGEHGWNDGRALATLGLGGALLAAFGIVERHVAAPLVPPAVLRRPTIRWGNLAGLLAFATETSLVFLLTLYLQRVLGYPPLVAGGSFAVLGVGTVLGGLLGPRLVTAWGGRRAIVAGFLAQAAATAPLLLLGPDRAWVVMLLVATFAGGVANLVVIVGFMVTATSGLPDEEQGLATGIATLSQQVGITVGIPAMSAVVAAVVRSFDTESVDTVLSGVTAAIAVNAGGCLVGALLAGLLLPAPPDTRATPADPLPSVSPPRGPGLP